MLQMADQSAANDAAGRSEVPKLRGYVDSFPVGASIELDLGAKGASYQNTQKKRKKACMDRNLTFEDKLAFIKECQHELDGLFEFYKELSSCKLHLEEGHFNSMNSAVACMLEESSLSFSALVEEIYGKMKAKEGNPGATLASIRSAVLFVGQRVMYGVVNEDVDVLEDASENCLWCWETRDMKLLPKTRRGFLSVRRTGRKKVHERISALSTTISSLSRLADENHQSNLIKASQRLQKALNLSEIRLLVEKLNQKSNAEMAEKEAKLKEKELIKELERNKHSAEMERKRIDQENQRKQQQAEKELKRLQEEAATEEKRLEKERAELKKQLKKQEMQAKKDQQRHEKEAAELKKQLKIQKQATIMQRFLKRTKVNDSFDLTSSQEALIISEATCKGESMVNSASLLMDHALLLHESPALDDLRRLHIVRWHKCRHSSRSNRWGVRSKPKINLFQGLKLLGQSSETGPFDRFSFPDKDLTDKSRRYSSEAVLDKQLSECAAGVSNHNKCHDSVENTTANCLVKKLLQFDKSNRPAYYGTWSKKSILGPRNPYKKDPDLDYEVDSEEEWVEEEPGESLSDCERDKEDEVLDEENMKEGSDDESEDSFLVPDGYLSENEGVQVDKSSDSMDGDSRNLTGTQKETENEDFRTFFQQQKYLNNLTEQALRKCHPLIITNLMHEKSASLISDTIDGTARLEQICLQVLCMRPCPGGSAIEVPSDHLVSKDQEQQNSPANNISTSPAPAVIPDTELPEFVRAIQSSPQSINKVVKSLQLKFSSISKCQIKNKVKEISDYSDHRWQVKKEVLDRLGLSISTNKTNNKEKGIAKFFTKRCLSPRDLPLKFPESSPDQPSKTPLIQSEEDRSTTALICRSLAP